MTHTHSRTCCCCLPVRFGVITFTVLGLLVGSLVAAAGILRIQHFRTFFSSTPLRDQLTIDGLAQRQENQPSW